MEIIPEPQWKGLIEALVKHKGTALLLGATDSGKSTLAKYLIKRLVSENIRVSIVDSDVGQSSIGLPGTISMKVFCNQRDVENFRFDRMSFIGTANPAKNLSVMINETKRLVDICREKSEITLIDTTGLIAGELGKALKIRKVRAVKPVHIIAVQRDDELEHILSLIESIRIHRVRASRMAKCRSRAYRIRYRKTKLNEYFTKTALSEFLVSTHDAVLFYHGKTFSPKDKDFPENTVVGLNHNDDTMALGLIAETSQNSIVFKSPIISLKGINRLVFGDMVI